MSFPKNEVAADNQRRRMEELSESPVGGVIENAVSVARPALTVASAVIASGASAGTGLAVAGSVVAGLGIVDWFRKLGTAKVNENLESLGQATEDALNRVERALLEHDTSINEIKSRLSSQGFKDGMASASLQALRTTQADRLKRLALILANGVKEDDLEPEKLDDMMRAAVELKERDILALGFICSCQSKILADAERWPQLWFDSVRADWQKSSVEQSIKAQLAGSDDIGLKSSLSRLAAFGFIVAIPPVGTANSPGKEPYALLSEGLRFYERLQEIAAD
jgi:hypothetical protein